MGIICGVARYYLLLGVSSSPDSGEFNTIIAYAISVGLSLLMMTITNSEHPLAAGTVLGLTAYGWSSGTVIFTILCAIALSIVRRLLRPFLRDLI